MIDLLDRFDERKMVKSLVSFLILYATTLSQHLSGANRPFWFETEAIDRRLGDFVRCRVDIKGLQADAHSPSNILRWRIILQCSKRHHLIKKNLGGYG
jgi:hypothetical protein